MNTGDVLVEVHKEGVRVVSVVMSPHQVVNLTHYDFGFSVRFYPDALLTLKGVDLADVLKEGLNKAIDLYVEERKKKPGG